MTALATDLSLRQKVEFLQHELEPLPQIEIPLQHHFIRGVYAREMTVPKDALWIGKIHKFDQINMLLKGDMSVMIDDVMTRVQAPFTYVAPAGTKRIGYAHEESVWTCIVRTEDGWSEPDMIEDDGIFVADTDAEYLEYIGQQSLLERK